MAAGADGIELDVHLSADGVVVVHHDATLDRTTNATGLIAARTATELGRVDAAYHFCTDGRFPFRSQGIGVPTLREVLRRHDEAFTIIEMKVDDPALGVAVADEVRRASAVDRVCIAGYGTRCSMAARAALPEAACSATLREVRTALCLTWAGWRLRNPLYGGYQIPEVAGRLRVVSPRFVRYAHDAGLKVQVWIVDDEQEMTRLLAWGVDGLISNRPDVAVRVRDQFQSAAVPS
jgi:glycerophosphoryl diester phosphodiesterase